MNPEADDHELVAPAVERDADSGAFFDAAAAGTLLLRRCLGCAELHGQDVRACSVCGSPEFTDAIAGGHGRLVSWAVLHHCPSGPPLVCAVVELTEGPWLTVRLVDPPAELHVGLALRVAFRRSGDTGGEGEIIPVCTPEADR